MLDKVNQLVTMAMEQLQSKACKTHYIMYFLTIDTNTTSSSVLGIMIIAHTAVLYLLC